MNAGDPGVASLGGARFRNDEKKRNPALLTDIFATQLGNLDGTQSRKLAQASAHGRAVGARLVVAKVNRLARTSPYKSLTLRDSLETSASHDAHQSLSRAGLLSGPRAPGTGVGP